METPTVRILLVDTDANYRAAFAKFFGKYPGFEVRQAANGQEAYYLVKETPPDLILSEYDMPLINGLELCRHVRSIPEAALAIFVFLTSEKDEKIRANAFECGADDYIDKSTAPVILTSKIIAFLRIKNLQNELRAEKDKITEINRTLERNFKELTQILLKIIDLKVPGAADRARTARAEAHYVCTKMGILEEEESKVIFGAQLYEIGKIGLPDTVADKDKLAMVMNDRSIYNQHPVIGSLIISTISGYKTAADAIYHQYENYDGSGTPDGLIGNEIPAGARILRGIVLQSDLCRAGRGRDDILREIRQSANKILDPMVASALAEYIIDNDRDSAANRCKVALEELEAGMIIAEDIYAASGIKLIPKNVKIHDHMISLLMQRNASDPIIGGVYVLMGVK